MRKGEGGGEIGVWWQDRAPYETPLNAVNPDGWVAVVVLSLAYIDDMQFRVSLGKWIYSEPLVLQMFGFRSPYVPTVIRDRT